MQPELPWNVAGIAPEAREAARASARREGLSVGEWLTRRILKSLAENDAQQDDWWTDATPQRRTLPESGPPSQESVDMLAHVSRSESETQSSGRRIEDQLKSLARRLEYTERSQSEHSRAVTQAASEINIVSREQAQAFDQLGAHVVRLDERLARIEQLAAADGTRDAIKALHLGLSRLADQMAETATRSSEQAAQLAEHMGAVVGKLAESREEGRQNWRALEERVAALAANVGAIAGRLLESRELSERAFKSVDARLGAAEETLARLDAAHAVAGSESAEIRSHGIVLSQLSDSVEALSRRMAASESDMTQQVARLDAAEHRFDAELRNHAARMDAAGDRQKSAVAEVSVLVKELSARVDAARAAPADSAAAKSGAARYGLPPFGETAHSTAETATPRPVGAGLESFFASRHGGSGESAAAAKTFSWNEPAGGPLKENRRTWIVLTAALAGLVIAAVVAGMILGRTREPPMLTAPATPPTHAAVSVPFTPEAPPSATAKASNAEAQQRNPQTIPPLTGARVPQARPMQSPPVATQDRLAALANAGNAKAETLLGIDYVDGHGRPVNEAEGAKWLERAALQGQALAAWRLGTMYERGEGVPDDAAKSVQWYMVAAKAGNRKAMHNLAVAYANGNGIAKDMAKAAQWFGRAAALGLADSQYNLAVLYERGLGVAQNLKAAYTWYAIAAAGGDAGSQARLASLASQMSADDKAAAEKAASEFHTEPLDAAANSPPATSDMVAGG